MPIRTAGGNAASLKSPFPPACRALLFDLDGTLYDSRKVRRAVVSRLAREVLLRPRTGLYTLRVLRAYRAAHERLRQAVVEGSLSEAQLQATIAQTRLDPEFVRACVAEWMERGPLPDLKAAMWDGVPDFLTLARSRGLRLGVCSDYPARGKLAAMGLLDRFEVVVQAQDPGIQRLKPDPALLRAALDQLGVDSSAAVYFGDRPEVDGEAARRTGIEFVLVPGARGVSPYRELAAWMAG